MSSQEYPAPALEKGLDILELLAGRTEAMSPAEVASALGRSKAEIYRMLITLETDGYIARLNDSSDYLITERLFDLGLRHPPRQQLIDAALPHMRNLANQTEQSCHMTVVTGDYVTAVARAESNVSACFSLKVGYRVSAAHSSSGRVIYAFQARKQQAAWLGWMRTQFTRLEMKNFLEDARTAAHQGYLIRDSHYTKGIVDLVAPIFQSPSTDAGSRAVAALIVPYLNHRQNFVTRDQVFEKLLETAKLISKEAY